MTGRDAKDGKSALGKASPRGDQAMRRQYGALPYRVTSSGSLELLLVTTRRTRRWTIPKGWPAKKLKPRDCAAREAYEEAGVRGTIGQKSIGSFTYEKVLDNEGLSISCEVSVFPLRVEQQFETWPEAHERQCIWLDPRGAVSVVTEVGLRHLIDLLVDRITERVPE